MARIRSIHPGYFTDECVVSVSMEARMLLLGLGVEADDKGAFVWKPITIKMRIFPADSLEVAPLLDELSEANLICRYEVEGKVFGAIRNFRVHQRPKTPNDIHPMPENIRNYVGLTPAVSEIGAGNGRPFPPKGEKPIQMEDVGCRVEDETATNVSVIADKPAPKPKKQSRKTQLPERWFPSLKNEADAQSAGLSFDDIDCEKVQFRDYHRSRGNTMLDWDAAWRTWCRNSIKFNKRGAQPQKPLSDLEMISRRVNQMMEGET